MKELLNKKIRRIFVSDDQAVIAFDVGDGFVAYRASADCCSESWFADLTGYDALIGGTVTSALTVDLENYNVSDGRTRQEVDEAYGWKIETDKGRADIVMRNSSNGYYGGWIGAFNLERLDGLKEIIGDWQA